MSQPTRFSGGGAPTPAPTTTNPTTPALLRASSTPPPPPATAAHRETATPANDAATAVATATTVTCTFGSRLMRDMVLPTQARWRGITRRRRPVPVPA